MGRPVGTTSGWSPVLSTASPASSLKVGAYTLLSCFLMGVVDSRKLGRAAELRHRSQRTHDKNLARRALATVSRNETSYRRGRRIDRAAESTDESFEAPASVSNEQTGTRVVVRGKDCEEIILSVHYGVW